MFLYIDQSSQIADPHTSMHTHTHRVLMYTRDINSSSIPVLVHQQKQVSSIKPAVSRVSRHVSVEVG